MSDELIEFMVKELSTTKYGYRATVEAYYRMGIAQYGLTPSCDMEKTIDTVTQILNDFK